MARGRQRRPTFDPADERFLLDCLRIASHWTDCLVSSLDPALRRRRDFAVDLKAKIDDLVADLSGRGETHGDRALPEPPSGGDYLPGDRAFLIDCLGKTRDSVQQLSNSLEPSTPRDRLCDKLKYAIDLLAGDLTGDRTIFHMKGHGSPYGGSH